MAQGLWICAAIEGPSQGDMYEDALRILITLQERLLELQNQTPEVRYLQCFASVLARDPIINLKYSDLAMRALEIFKVPYEAVDLNMVPKHVKQKFPLRGHPAWQEGT